MQHCTLWYRYVEPDRPGLFPDPWQFNHLEDGHSRASSPAPKHPSQNGWSGGRWQRVHAGLTDSLPPRVVRGPEEAADYPTLSDCVAKFYPGV